MIVYHGSSSLFDEFDYSKIGINGTQEGKGFYFTDTKRVAEAYGENGYIYTIKFNGQKQLSTEKVTISREEFKQYIVELDKQTEYLSMWGEVAFEGLEQVLNNALEGEYDEAETDADLIASVIHTSGDTQVSLELLYQMFGYDSMITNAKWGTEQRLYIALVRDILEIQKVEPAKS